MNGTLLSLRQPITRAIRQPDGGAAGYVGEDREGGAEVARPWADAVRRRCPAVECKEAKTEGHRPAFRAGKQNEQRSRPFGEPVEGLSRCVDESCAVESEVQTDEVEDLPLSGERSHYACKGARFC